MSCDLIGISPIIIIIRRSRECISDSKIKASDGACNVDIFNADVVVLDKRQINADSADVRDGELNLQVTVVRILESTTTAHSDVLNELHIDFYANEIKKYFPVVIAGDERDLSIDNAELINRGQ